jgi:hypothetical protein
MNRIASLAALITLCGTFCAETHAQPPPPSAPFQRVLQEGRLLQFHDGRWHSGTTKLFESAPIVVEHSKWAYATIEIYGENLPRSTTVEFIGNADTVEDKVVLPTGNTQQMVRTIPLGSETVRVRIQGPAAAVGSGRIAIARVLRPLTAGDVPVGIGNGLTSILLFAGSLSPEKRALADAAQAVAFIQIADPTETNACTGFLVAPDLIATAAHCLRTARAAESAQSGATDVCRRIGLTFDFRSAERGNGTVQSIHCRSVLVLKAENPVPRDHGLLTGVDRSDIALLSVDAASIKLPSGSARPYVALDTTASGTLSTVVQHPQGDVQLVASDCAWSRESEAPLLSHKCSTAPGSSGSPILQLKADGKWVVIGIHTCCSHQGSVSGDTAVALQESFSITNFGISASALAAAMPRNGN